MFPSETRYQLVVCLVNKERQTLRSGLSCSLLEYFKVVSVLQWYLDEIVLVCLLVCLIRSAIFAILLGINETTNILLDSRCLNVCRD